MRSRNTDWTIRRREKIHSLSWPATNAGQFPLLISVPITPFAPGRPLTLPAHMYEEGTSVFIALHAYGKTRTNC